MGTEQDTADWRRARVALADSAARAASLVRTVRNPRAPALGEWDVAGLAAHLSHAFDIVPALARRDLASPLTDLWDQPALTKQWVADDSQRDLGVLADLIEARAEAFLHATEAASASDPCPWLIEGVDLPLAVLTCHLLNEVVVHGYDIARADGRSLPIEGDVAALILMGFLLPVFRALDHRAMVVPEKVARLRAAYDVRLRGGGGRFTWVFDDGGMRIEEPSSRRVDCHLSVDPVAFLLLGWGRISQWQALPKGQLLAWGRRPWLGLRLRGLVRNP